MTVGEFKEKYLEEIQMSVDDIELAFDDFYEDSNISNKDSNYLMDYAQSVITALENLKALVDDLH
jgi:hypothetical protein